MACWVPWLNCRCLVIMDVCSPYESWLSCLGVELRVCWPPDPRLTPSAVSQTVCGCVRAIRASYEAHQIMGRSLMPLHQPAAVCIGPLLRLLAWRPRPP